METRRYAIFQNDYSSMWSAEIVLGPANISLVQQAFTKFYFPRCDFGAEFFVFCSPCILGDLPTGKIQIPFWQTIVPSYSVDIQRVVAALFPELSDPWEYIDEAELSERTFRPLIKNRAWGD